MGKKKKLDRKSDCKANTKQLSASDRKRQEKQAWKESFANDPIDLTELPKNVVLKARWIITGLQKKRDYRQFRGKRLRHNRFIISIPVTRDYRLLCRDCGSILEPQAVISHQDYNVCKPGS